MELAKNIDAETKEKEDRESFKCNVSYGQINIDRDAETYRSELGIDLESLKEKELRLLEIGSSSGWFLESCEKEKIFAIGVDPKYTKIKTVSCVSPVVAGVNEYLPFRSETFDLIVISWASIFYVPSNYSDEEKVRKANDRMFFIPSNFYDEVKARKADKRMFKELFRALKPGGKAVIYPLDTYNERGILRAKRALKEIDEESKAAGELDTFTALFSSYRAYTRLVLTKIKRGQTNEAQYLSSPI